MKKSLILLALLLSFSFPAVCWGALDVAITWEMQDTATSSSATMYNGGGFKTGASGTDYSQGGSMPANGAPHLAFTDLETKNADYDRVYSSTENANMVAGTIGNVIHIISGTGFIVGWYEVTGNGDGGGDGLYLDIDRDCNVGNQNDGTANLGGCLSLGVGATALDDDFLEIIAEGNIVYIKKGTYTVAETISNITNDASAIAPITIEGYKTSRGDNPTEDDRPLIAVAGYGFRLASYYRIRNLRFTTSSTSGIHYDVWSIIENCFSINSSTGTDRAAFTCNTYSATITAINCEGVSTNGRALVMYNAYPIVIGFYAHDSKVGIFGVPRMRLSLSIIDSCVVSVNLGSWDSVLLMNNTIYYAVTGIAGTDAHGNIFMNNIIDSCTTGANWATANQKIDWWDYNNWNNNGTDVTNVTKGENATAVDPAFTDVTTIEGDDGETSGGVLTSSTAKDFSDVVTNQDYCWIKSGTGVTADEFHLITAVNDGADTITLSPDPGDSGTDDITWSVTTGHDFNVAVAMKAGGFPGAFPGALTTGYLDQGAVQREEPEGNGNGVSATGSMMGVF